jgi:hypothetical protein
MHTMGVPEGRERKWEHLLRTNGWKHSKPGEGTGQ